MSDGPMQGETLGHFEILEPIGAGGMGEVYLAQDTQLNRKVALKMLPPAFTDDPERLGRFKREAETLAALSDPRIGQIYGLETSGARHALVLELIAGPTLAERIAEGPIPEDEALGYALEIAGALEAAHRAGIVHRDLKPANIKLPPGGGVKVLDFGLAKAVEGDRPQPDVANSPTLTMQATQAGVVLGTAAYMAPEQAKGAPVDKRADIWAFGAVLFEMLTGRKAFKGSDTSEILASVLAREPEWEALPGSEGSRIRSLLTRCLSKNPEQRYRDIGDVALQLQEIRDIPEPAAATAGATGGTLRTALLASAATLLVCLGLFALWSSTRAPAAESTVARFTVEFPGGLGPFAIPGIPKMALAPDGGTLAFNERGEIWLREMGDLVARQLRTDESVYSPIFSPDGEWVAFASRAPDSMSIHKTRIAGGASVRLASLEGEPGWIVPLSSWTERDTILTSGTRISEIPADGGEPVTLLELESGYTSVDAQRLPDGDRLLYVAGNQRRETLGYWPGELTIHDLETDERRVLLAGVQGARLLDGGLLAVVQNGTLGVGRLDLDRLELSEATVPVLDGIPTSPTDGGADFAVSDSGTVAFLDPPDSPGSRLMWVDRSGAFAPLDLERDDYSQPRLSPQGDRFVVQIGTDLWVHDLGRGTTTKITQEGGSRPVWMPDGRTIIYANNDGLARVRADGSAPPEPWLDGRLHSNSISPDGRTFVYHTHESGGADLMLMDMESGEPEVWLATPFQDDAPSVSPDGSAIAFVSNSSGRNEVFVAPLYGERSRTQASVDGGTQPLWVGDSIYFRDADENTYAVDVSTEPELTVGRPELLFRFEDPPPAAGPFANYDVTPDGERFLMVEGDSDPGRMIVTINWLEELRDQLR